MSKLVLRSAKSDPPFVRVFSGTYSAPQAISEFGSDVHDGVGLQLVLAILLVALLLVAASCRLCTMANGGPSVVYAADYLSVEQTNHET